MYKTGEYIYHMALFSLGNYSNLVKIYVAGLCSLYHDNRPRFQFVTICTCHRLCFDFVDLCLNFVTMYRATVSTLSRNVMGYCFSFVML